MQSKAELLRALADTLETASKQVRSLAEVVEPSPEQLAREVAGQMERVTERLTCQAAGKASHDSGRADSN